MSEHPVIFDCGSHIGVSVLYFKKKFPGSCITSFEPNPQTFRLLRRNTSQNNPAEVTLVNAAVSDKKGTMLLYSPKLWDDVSWGNTLRKDIYPPGSFKTEKVNVVRLSSYIHGPVDFLKLDVEGAELNVLKDIRPKLHFVRHLVVELHTDYMNITAMYSEVRKLLGKRFTITSLRRVGALTSWNIRTDQLTSEHAKYYLLRAEQNDT